MKYRLDFPGLAFIKVEPDPANPGAILTACADGSRPRSFIFSLDECGKLARALAEYVPAEEPGVRPCPVCGHDEREEDQVRILEQVHIVFDGPPSHKSGRFVEVEDSTGKSIRLGEWRERQDGLWELVINAEVST